MYHDIFISFIFRVIPHCFLKSTEVPKGLSQYAKIFAARYREHPFNSWTMLDNKLICRSLFCKAFNCIFNIRLYLKLTTDSLFFEISKDLLLFTIRNLILISDYDKVTMTLLRNYSANM